MNLLKVISLGSWVRVSSGVSEVGWAIDAGGLARGVRRRERLRISGCIWMNGLSRGFAYDLALKNYELFSRSV